MTSLAPPFSSSKARLLRDAHNDMMSNDYPLMTSTILNDKFLSVLSSQLIKCSSVDDKQLRSLALNILSWILSRVSSSCQANESVAQNDIIIQSCHIQTSFDRAIGLITSEGENVEVVNLCLFMLMQQSTPELIEGRMPVILEAISSCLCSSNRIANGNPFDCPTLDESWKTPILACSALYNLMEQHPEKVLSRHLSWSVDVFFLLVDSFTPSSQSSSPCTGAEAIKANECAVKGANFSNGIERTSDSRDSRPGSKDDCNSSRSRENKSNVTNCSTSSIYSDFDSLRSRHTALPDSRLLPLSITCLRLLSRIPFCHRQHLLPIAIDSSRAAMEEIR